MSLLSKEEPFVPPRGGWDCREFTHPFSNLNTNTRSRRFHVRENNDDLKALEDSGNEREETMEDDDDDNDDTKNAFKEHHNTCDDVNDEDEEERRELYERVLLSFRLKMCCLLCVMTSNKNITILIF